MSSQARCSGCEPSGDSPSMVVIRAFAALAMGVRHERTGWPPRWTVHAPHSPIPQPYFVPCRFRTSRITHRRGVSGGTSTAVDRPLTVRLIAIVSTPTIPPEETRDLGFAVYIVHRIEDFSHCVTSILVA